MKTFIWRLRSLWHALLPGRSRRILLPAAILCILPNCLVCITWRAAEAGAVEADRLLARAPCLPRRRSSRRHSLGWVRLALRGLPYVHEPLIATAGVGRMRRLRNPRQRTKRPWLPGVERTGGHARGWSAMCKWLLACLNRRLSPAPIPIVPPNLLGPKGLLPSRRFLPPVVLLRLGRLPSASLPRPAPLLAGGRVPRPLLLLLHVPPICRFLHFTGAVISTVVELVCQLNL